MPDILAVCNGHQSRDSRILKDSSVITSSNCCVVQLKLPKTFRKEWWKMLAFAFTVTYFFLAEKLLFWSVLLCCFGFWFWLFCWFGVLFFFFCVLWYHCHLPSFKLASNLKQIPVVSVATFSQKFWCTLIISPCSTSSTFGGTTVNVLQMGKLRKNERNV